MTLIDFSNCKVVNTKLYGDSNGKKKVLYTIMKKNLKKEYLLFQILL